MKYKKLKYKSNKEKRRIIILRLSKVLEKNFWKEENNKKQNQERCINILKSKSLRYKIKFINLEKQINYKNIWYKIKNSKGIEQENNCQKG